MKSVSVLVSSELAPVPIYRTGHRWGRWRFNRQSLTLELLDRNGNRLYEIDLERCRTSAQILDWLAQLSGKTYVLVEDLGCLVRALDALIDNLQARVCGGGFEHGPINWRHLLEITPDQNSG